MHQSIFAELSLIIAIAAAMALVMRLIRQPLIIGHILTGILVGPSVLGAVKSGETIEVFSNIGIALLLFIIGLGLNPKIVKEVGRVATFAGLIQVVFTALFAYGGGLILGYSKVESAFFGVALAFSSTIIILKLLSDKKEQNRLYGKVATGMLLVQDILAILALLFVTSQESNGVSASHLLVLISKGLAVAVPLLLIGNFLLPRWHRFIASSQELLFLFAIGWGFGSAALFEMAGFSIEVGALVAGIALASLPYTQEISARLRPLRDFFIVVFFISLGTRVDFSRFTEIIPALSIGLGITIFFKPLTIMVLMGLMGYTKRTSFKTSVAMAQVSEFSLVFVILGNKLSLINESLVGVITLTALISIAISSYLIIYSDKLFVIFEKYLSLFERRKSHYERESKHRFDLILFGYQKGGHEFLKVFQGLNKPYVLIDYDPDIIDSLERQKLPYLYGDATDIELLEEAGIESAKLIVSTMTDHETNTFLLQLIENKNPNAVVILYGESIEQASELYDMGASYVIMPHFIGSEKIGSFIRRNGLNKSEFKKYRQRHLAYLQSLYQPEE